MGNYVGTDPNKLEMVITDDYSVNSSDIVASSKAVQNAVTDILGQMGSNFTVEISTKYNYTNNASATGTWTIDYTTGPVIAATATGNITTITVNNWPASGTAGHLKLLLTNFGAYTITFPASWKFTKTDMTTVAFSSLGITLPASGTVMMDLVTVDGGTNVYASVVRN